VLEKKGRSKSKCKIEKNDKSNTKVVHFGANRNDDLETDLKILSQLIGALFFCGLNFKFKVKICSSA